MAAPEWWNRRVKAKYKELSTALRPSVLVDDLLSEDVISLEDYHQLRADRTEMDRARKLLTEILPYGGEDRLDKLCNILENSDQQQHLVDLIGKRTRPTVVEPRSVPISNEIMQGRLESPQGNLTMSGQLVLDHSGHGQCATSTAVNVAIGALISDPCKHGAADHQGQTHSTRTGTGFSADRQTDRQTGRESDRSSVLLVWFSLCSGYYPRQDLLPETALSVCRYISIVHIY